MLIVVMIACVGGLCVVAGVAGLLADSADLPAAALNLGVGLLTELGVGYAFLKRRPR